MRKRVRVILGGQMQLKLTFDLTTFHMSFRSISKPSIPVTSRNGALPITPITGEMIAFKNTSVLVSTAARCCFLSRLPSRLMSSIASSKGASRTVSRVSKVATVRVRRVSVCSGDRCRTARGSIRFPLRTEMREIKG